MSKDLLRTALLIPSPESEPVVGHWRARFDPSSVHGVPAHLTLVFPFLPSGRYDAGVSASLRHLFERTASFEYALTRFGDFPGVVYLAPDPSEPFVQIIESLVRRYPEAPPYAGAFDSVIPHLTLAHSCDPTARARITSDVEKWLPIRCSATEVLLMRENVDGLWQVWERFPLNADEQ